MIPLRCLHKILLAALVLFSSGLTAKSGWVYDLEEAKLIARQEGKLILVNFGAVWNSTDKKLDAKVWDAPEIRRLLNKFVPTRLDLSRHLRQAQDYNLQVVPAILILDAWGDLIYQYEGNFKKREIRRMMLEFPAKVFPLNTSLRYLHTNTENPYTNLWVAEQYQNFSFMLKGKARKSFLQKSDDYLRKSKKYASKRRDRIILEKADLLRDLNACYHGQIGKNVKKLERKVENNKIYRTNLALAYFVLVSEYRQIGDPTKEQTFLDRLKKVKGSKRLVRKLRRNRKARI